MGNILLIAGGIYFLVGIGVAATTFAMNYAADNSLVGMDSVWDVVEAIIAWPLVLHELIDIGNKGE